MDSRLDRTLHIAIDEHRIFDDLRLVGERFEHALQADRRLNGALLERLALAIGRDLTGSRLILFDRARVARPRNAAKAEPLHRPRPPGGLHLPALIVHPHADPAAFPPPPTTPPSL